MRRLSLLLCAVLFSSSSYSQNLTPIAPISAPSIYQYLLENHWRPSTGLFLSFVGTGDRKLSQQASTYEQGAVGLLAIALNDRPRADQLISFFKKTWNQKAGFVNFYNAEFGSEGIEKTVHVGPNAWVGLFIARYANTYHDAEATQLAKAMAQWMMNDIPHEKGGIAMGPFDGANGVPWRQVFSTENNVSYYAFLSELLRSTELSTNERLVIENERGQIENWLVTVAYDPLMGTMNRGTNPAGVDRIRALDTITWLVSAVGPHRLIERGLSPLKLMERARNDFEVTLGDLKGVDPTDQPEADTIVALHIPTKDKPFARSPQERHPMIWFEGLGQYISALNLVAQEMNIEGYRNRASLFLDSFRQTNFPPMYATPGKFFHDGWWTPKAGENGEAASLISSTWRCFAEMGWDPMANEWVTDTASYGAEQAPTYFLKIAAKPDLLFGTSDDMAAVAWKALDAKKEDIAIAQAQATIEEWGSYADQLQKQKLAEHGSLIGFDGSEERKKAIFKYWALNDVASAYFILGKAYDEQGKYTLAQKAFQQILTNYDLAEVWDPRGWFWAPSEAIMNDYVNAYPQRYGSILSAQNAEPAAEIHSTDL